MPRPVILSLICCAVACVVMVASPGYGAVSSGSSINEEKQVIDRIIQTADSVQLRNAAPQILKFAEKIRVAEGDAAARPYFEKGLEGNAWALDEQLTYGELLGRAGQPDGLQGKIEMVLRLGEEDTVLRRASALAKRPPPPEPIPFTAVAADETTLALIPIGDVHPLVLEDLKAELAKRLGIAVVIARVELEPLKPDRTAKAGWIARTRAQIMNAIEAQPALAAEFGRLGFTFAQIQANDDALIALARKIAEAEQGAEGLARLDAMLAQVESVEQFDAEKIVAVLGSRVADRVGPKLLALGVTGRDIFGGKSNFLFGTAAIGKFVGIISTHRFRAAFNQEAPKRARLIARLAKQSLSTIGFMAGVPRCTTPECARTYPESLAEHDQKPGTLCSSCRSGIETALGRKLPSD